MDHLNVIHQFNQSQPLLSKNYELFGSIMSGIRTALFEKYGETYMPYSTDDAHFEVWTVLEEDVKSESDRVEHVAQILDMLENYTFEYDETMDNPTFAVHRAIQNHVYAYPNEGVAFAKIPAFDDTSIYGIQCVLATDNERMQQFLESMRERLWEKSKQEVLTFTDSYEGLQQKHQPVTHSVDREDVVMNAETKQEIYGLLDQFFTEDRSFFTRYDIPYKRGILLYGPPGNGKTTLVKSVAKSIDAPVAYWQITEFTSSETINEVFQSARRLAPMILVVEDIDAMPKEARSFFLNTLDGATSKEGLFLIGTTNFPEEIDPGLINRAGRFDRGYEIPLPTQSLREEYLQKVGFSDMMSAELISEIASDTDGFSFAQLKELFISAATDWHTLGNFRINHWLEQMKGANRKSRNRNWLDKKDGRVGFN
ncbi:hypothetical protein JOC54_003994 [Alkalihalobacillus xiaoxiensis]|uniref:AAA+ ATPase domain-containing protein n=1 Tax=Shouchella xiaoxiensis TaxID=766895 RepID=A0ABS2T0B3_9BACI|nr:ATP-binding protein [Shouchella xiaoxiensis]MBM7840701.1 hypothetical protein [Shouchella xiaoxiensis]